jgi:hypothetical protein
MNRELLSKHKNSLTVKEMKTFLQSIGSFHSLRNREAYEKRIDVYRKVLTLHGEMIKNKF